MDPQERKELIRAGAIEPIVINAKLNAKEKAYTVINAKRTAMIDQTVEITKGKSKRKGVLTRGLVGAAVTAPFGIGIVGGVVGAATAGNKTHSKTSQKTASKFEIIDAGELILTNQRILFIGNKEILSIPYEALLDYSFGRNLLGRTFTPRYESMLPHESFILSGAAAPEAEDFFIGITQNIAK